MSKPETDRTKASPTTEKATSKGWLLVIGLLLAIGLSLSSILGDRVLSTDEPAIPAVQAPASVSPPLDSPSGRAMLAAAGPMEDLLTLVRYYEGQHFISYCGVASAVTVLNALGIPGPTTGLPVLGNYQFFTQENVFTTAAMEVRNPMRVKTGGMNLMHLTGILQANGATVVTRFADEQKGPKTAASKEGASKDGKSTHRDAQAVAAALRLDLLATMGEPNTFIIANYHRPALDQKGGGHISPLAAWDEASQRVLILDVANYRYPPVWASIDKLAEGMLAVDNDSGRSRGWLLVKRGG